MMITTVFLAMKKVGVRQYEDSDSNPGVGVSMQSRVPLNGHQRGSHHNSRGVRGHAPLGIFCFIEGL